MNSPSAPVPRHALLVSLGRVPVLVTCDAKEEYLWLSNYLLPALASDEPPQAEVWIRKHRIEITSGPDIETDPSAPVLHQLESLLIEWCAALEPAARLLHAGCVIFDGRPILLLAPSGAGKSTLTLAAVRAGAAYVTDDLVLASSAGISGFARAIRFKALSEEDDCSTPYLKGMDLTSASFELEGRLRRVPIYPGPYQTQAWVTPNTPPVVVLVSRGPDQVEEISALERVVALHESAIVRHGEYDGSLGPGPSYRLTWTDPNRAFSMLLSALRNAQA